MKNAANISNLTSEIQLLNEEIKNVKEQHAEEKSKFERLQIQTISDAFQTV